MPLHGYCPDALDRLGYGASARRALAPALIDGQPRRPRTDRSLGRPSGLRQFDAERSESDAAFAPASVADEAPEIERTSWGPARRLGSDPAVWA